MREQYMRTGEGFLLVYSIDSKESFDEAKGLYEQLQRVKDEDFVPALLVGNKCDLESKRKVNTWGESLSVLFSDELCGADKIGLIGRRYTVRLTTQYWFHRDEREAPAEC
jgi:hypothetical protein